jgi:ABC-type uncharacterized transport system involved in gliding motility auxiliary subunit
MALPDTRRRGGLAAIALLLAAALFVAFNVAVERGAGGLRVDLTRDKLFTLSPGTRSVLARIDEPISLRLYVSERLAREIPSYGVYAARVREMLQEYRAAARGRIDLRIIDPAPFSDEEERAIAAGIQGVPVNQAGEVVYFGLAGANSADKEEVIPFLQPERERFLEYDLTKLVYNLVTAKKKPVGLLSTIPLQGQFMGPRVPPQPMAIYAQLESFFEIRRIERDAASIPDDLAMLAIVHPQNLPEKTQYAIDQFVLRGGRVLVFVDPHAEGDMARPGPAAQTGMTSSNLPRLFAAWGLEMLDGKVAADRAAARRVNAGDAQRVRAVDYVVWVGMREPNFDRSDVLLADTQLLNFASAGILRPLAGATTTLTPLVRTSDQSMEIDADQLKFAPDPVALLANFKPSGERYTLVARVRGPAKTAFPDGAPKEEEEKKEGDQAAAAPAAAPAPAAAAHLAESKGAINVIVVADTDLLEDRFWAQVQDFFGQRMVVPVANNGDFVVNAIDNLSGDDALISLRSRGQSARPFTVVQDLQREAELAFRAKERALNDRLKATQEKLNELQKQEQGQGASRAVLTQSQQQAIDQFRAELLDTRRQLREVQFELNRDINRMQFWVQFVNIAGVPALVALFALGLWAWRARRRRAAVARPAH